jgi:orotate phosphoribosyltransferase
VLGAYAERNEQTLVYPEPNASVVFHGHWLHSWESLVIKKDDFVFRRGYDKLIPGKQVLVVEDVLTTGGTVKKVVGAVRELGGIVVGVGALVNRGGITAKDVGDVPRLGALINITLDVWDEKACPLCEQGVPINTDVGKGREFLDRRG